MLRIGALSIGESPRPDLMEEIASVVGDERILQWGALDGLDAADVARTHYKVPLITKLRGEPVLVERAWMARRLQELIDRHHSQVDAFVILCAEDFSALTAPVPLFIPYVLAEAALKAMAFRGQLGVVCPVAGQVPSCRKKWEGKQWNATVEVASPYVAEQLDEAVERLVGLGSDLILLDCTSFGRDHARRLSAIHQKSVVAVRSFAWAVLQEFLTEDQT